MKNKLLLSAIMCAFAVLPVLASAETSNVSAKMRVGTSTDARLKAKAEFELRQKEFEQRREEIKDEMEVKREAFKAEMEQKKDVIRNELEDRKESIKGEVEQRREKAIGQIQERLNKFAQNVIERFDAAVERLEKLADRIDSRITKMEAENIDVKNAKDLMAIARIKLDTAKTSISGIDLESKVVASSTATSTVAFKADFEHLKAQLEKAKKDIKSAHAALVDVISNLKPGRNKTATTTNATSTPEDDD